MSHNSPEIRIPEFTMKHIPNGKICLFIGRRGSGKSFCIKDLLYHKRTVPIIKIFSATERSNKFYSNIVPPIFIEDEFSAHGLRNFYKRQVQLTQNRVADNNAILLLDDLQYSVNVWTRDNNMRQIFLNGRHDGISVIVALQYCLGLPPLFRSQSDFVFIYAEPTLVRRKQLFEYFSTGIDNFKKFCDILDGCTQDYNCLVINNTCNQNGTKYTEPLYYYKASEHENFRCCSDQAWSYSETNYTETPRVFDNDDDNSRSNKQKHKIILL